MTERMTDHLDFPFLDLSGASDRIEDPVSKAEADSAAIFVSDAVDSVLEHDMLEPSADFLAYADSIGIIPEMRTVETSEWSAPLARQTKSVPFPELLAEWRGEKPIEKEAPIEREPSTVSSDTPSRLPEQPRATELRSTAIESDFPPEMLARLTELATESNQERLYLAIRGTAKVMLYLIEELDVFFDMESVWREKQKDFRQKLQWQEMTEYERWGGIFFRVRKRPISEAELEELVRAEFDRKYQEYRSKTIAQLYVDADIVPSLQKGRKILGLRMKHLEELEFLLEFYSHKLRMMKRQSAEKSSVPMSDEDRKELVSKIESIREEFDREFAEQMGRSDWGYRNLDEFDRVNCHVSPSDRPRRKK